MHHPLLNFFFTIPCLASPCRTVKRGSQRPEGLEKLLFVVVFPQAPSRVPNVPGHSWLLSGFDHLWHANKCIILFWSFFYRSMSCQPLPHSQACVTAFWKTGKVLKSIPRQCVVHDIPKFVNSHISPTSVRVFGNVYLSAGQYHEVNIDGTPLPC